MGSINCAGRLKRTAAISVTPMNFFKIIRNVLSLLVSEGVCPSGTTGASTLGAAGGAPFVFVSRDAVSETGVPGVSVVAGDSSDEFLLDRKTILLVWKYALLSVEAVVGVAAKSCFEACFASQFSYQIDRVEVKRPVYQRE